MTDLIMIAVLAVIIAAAARYVYKARKSGAKCIGCSVGDSCCSHKSGEAASCGCGCGDGETTNTCCCHTDTQ